jgi:hypothetical protein
VISRAAQLPRNIAPVLITLAPEPRRQQSLSAASGKKIRQAIGYRSI